MSRIFHLDEIYPVFISIMIYYGFATVLVRSNLAAIVKNNANTDQIYYSQILSEYKPIGYLSTCLSHRCIEYQNRAIHIGLASLYMSCIYVSISAPILIPADFTD